MVPSKRSLRRRAEAWKAISDIVSTAVVGSAGFGATFLLLTTPPRVVAGAWLAGVAAVLAVVRILLVLHAASASATEEEQRERELADARRASDERELAGKRATEAGQRAVFGARIQGAETFLQEAEVFVQDLESSAIGQRAQGLVHRHARPRLPEALRDASELGIVLETLNGELDGGEKLLLELDNRVPPPVDYEALQRSLAAETMGEKVAQGNKANQAVFQAMGRERKVRELAGATAARIRRVLAQAQEPMANARRALAALSRNSPA